MCFFTQIVLCVKYVETWTYKSNFITWMCINFDYFEEPAHNSDFFNALRASTVIYKFLDYTDVR